MIIKTLRKSLSSFKLRSRPKLAVIETIIFKLPKDQILIKTHKDNTNNLIL